MKNSFIDILFEEIRKEEYHIAEFNRMLYSLDERKRKICTIRPTDSGNKIRKKCKVAKIWGLHYAPVWDRYFGNSTSTDSTADSGADGGTNGGIQEIQDDEFLNEKEKSSTERVRRFYKRHPERVRRYLKKTVKDRVARNRDRAKAVKRYGEAKMKNHDVHHPKGPHGGKWKLAKKDHGRDKKNKD
jgi:hypothetical protein